MNLYGMVNNNPTNRWDYLGLVTLDPDGNVIPDGEYQGNDHFIVRKCEILIIYGHRTRSDRRVRISTLGCSAAGGNVCDPGSVNENISRPLNGVETHHETMLFTDRYDTAEEEEPQGAGHAIRTSRANGIERDGNVVLRRLREAARKKAEELKKSCKCKSVTIYELRRGLGPPANPPTVL